MFAHTPYDGSKQPFTVGLEPIGECSWLEPDEHFAAHLERKAELLASGQDTVFRAEPETAASQREVLELITANLSHYHRDVFDTESGALKFAACEKVGSGLPNADLIRAAMLVQEDLVLMRNADDGYRLAAACLCFPSSWSLAEKFGHSMHAIHEHVPGFNNGRMGAIVARIFDNLKVGQLVARFNWSVYDSPELHRPVGRTLLADCGDEADTLARLFVRVERQTLRRLPGSGDILFTIKIHHDPLKALLGHPHGSELAAGLRNQLLGLDPDQLAYKGLHAQRDMLVRQLTEIEEGATSSAVASTAAI
ncbi:heme-dependent oxidative N-demethylase family protein [Roseibium sp.]|uniref:heme-dependent oxidative N-demethylase family protein n=1 Tax=Roseibium sp. TaxID=1936156 RepID=UPI003A985124